MIRKAMLGDIPKIGELLLQVDRVHHDGRPDIFKLGRKYSDAELAELLQDASRPILVSTDGNFEEAVKALREKGLAKAEAKQSRIAAEGLVDIMLSDDKNTAVMIEVNTETDFVAKNEKFQEYVKGLLRTIIACKPANVEEFMGCKFDGTEDTVEVTLKEQTFIIGEKLSIRRFVVKEGIMSTYIHGKGSMGVIIGFEADEAAVNNEGFAEYAKNIALQLAANPCEYVDRNAVPKEKIDAELEIIMHTDGNIMGSISRNGRPHGGRNDFFVMRDLHFLLTWF